MVGSAVVRHIVEHCPETFVRASYFRTEPFLKHDRAEYVQGDLRDQNACRKMVAGCDSAVMAAAFSGGSKVALNEPWRAVSENLAMNVGMLEAFHREGVKRIVFIASATLYQEFEGAIREDMLDFNHDPHPAYFGVGWTMRYLEKLCKFWHERFGMQALIARASNVFGPFDKFDPAVSHFIPALIRKAADRTDPFEVWGSPDVSRDVIYAEDFARGVVTLLNRHDLEYDIFNMGSGVPVTVGNVVKWILKYANHVPSEIRYDNRQPTTFKFRSLDCSKAERILGWKPACSAEEGIKKTMDWWIQYRDGREK